MTALVPEKRLRNVPKVLGALDALSKEVHSAKTYEHLKRIVRAAEVIKFWHSDITAIKLKAEDTILACARRIGEELDKVPKVKVAGPGRGNKTTAPREAVVSARSQVPRAQRSRYGKLAKAGAAAVSKAVKALREEGKDATPRAVANILTTGDKKQRRAERERDLAAKQTALPNKKYGVIVADPEWKFEAWSEETGSDRAAANHYPVATWQTIKDRPVWTIAAADAVLFLWATVPMLPQALEVMAAWDFTYRSHVIWAKNRIGTGYWFRNKHELLLVGTRGKIPAPAPGMQAASILEADVGRHSEKPEAFLKLIERYFPTLPKIELNRRGPARPGWDAWGNEVALAAE